MTNLDLFGHEIPAPISEKEKKRQARRRQARPRGYAAAPGAGPEGETCGTCGHRVRIWSAARYAFNKCGLIRSAWTKSRRTDILVRSPACKNWIERGDE